MQGENFKPKEDKAKHGLMIRPKYHFLASKVRAFQMGAKKEEKKEEGRREEENPGLEV